MKIYKVIVGLLVVFCAVGFALGSVGGMEVYQNPQKVGSSGSVQGQSQKKDNSTLINKENPFVDLNADLTESRSSKDSTIYFVGNVALHHNGAIIQCDSAKRYTNQEKMDFFGNVIITKDSAYIYGDMVSYDGNTNVAKVYAPIVKMVKGDAILYSYNLTYNTKDNIAYFEDGGVMNKGSNVMESFRGVFDADLNVVKFLDSVSLRSDQYDIKTDSVTYGLDDEIVTFLTRTHIWDKDSNIMIANKGFYYTKSETYEFFEDAYLLSREQETWGDTMNYYSPMRQATILRNVQVLDTVNKTISFADWAFYDDSLEVAILTRNPSVRMYDTEDSDTTFMRSDTMYMTTYEVKKPVLPDSLSVSDSMKKEGLILDSLVADSNKVDSAFMGVDSLAEMKKVLDSAEVAKATQVRDSAIRALPSAVDMYEQKMAQRARQLQVKDSIRTAEKARKQLLKLQKKMEKSNQSHGTTVKSATLDSIAKKTLIDSLSRKRDSLGNVDSVGMYAKTTGKTEGKEISETVAKDKVAQTEKAVKTVKSPGLMSDSLAKVSDSTLVNSADSLSKAINDTVYKTTKERIFRAYYNVKVWSKDYQAICDSVIAFSVDSVAQMHGSPIIWNENNQITSEQVNAYSKNEMLDWVEFLGDPFVTQKVVAKYPEPADSSRFNQAKGKQMYVYFKDNEIDSVFLTGNVINYYYMESDGYTSAFATIKCSGLVMFFENRTVHKMRWEGNPDWEIHPLEKIPTTLSEKIEGFSWQQDKRPKSAKEISDRTLRQSRRKEVEALQKPLFDIEKRIENYKKVVTENGSWTDRTDVNTFTVEFFKNRNETL